MTPRPTARSKPGIAQETPAEVASKHNRVLLHALQTAHPVMHREKQQFIHTLTFSQYGGGIRSVVYLTGDPAPIRPDEITLYEAPQ